MKTLTILKVVTALNVTVSAAFALAGIFRPGLVSHSNSLHLAHIFAVYSGVRAISIFGVLLVNLLKPAINGTIAIALLAILVQCGDALAGIAQSDASKVFGPLVLAIITAAALFYHNKKSALA